MPEKPELIVQVHDIDESGKDYSFSLPTAWLDAQLADAGMRHDPASGDGRLSVHVQKNGPEYLVAGTLQAKLLTECVRCLGDAQVPVHTQVATLYSREGAKIQPDALEAGGQDTLRETFSGNQIVLDDLVREHLVLECPMQPLCSEQCAGIAVPKHVLPPEEIFGKSSQSEGGVDPRLAPLMRLRDKVPPKSNKE